MNEKIKALLLFSGGLDSLLTAKLLEEQNIEISGLTISIPYFNVAKEVLPDTHFRPPIPEYMQISAQIVDAIQKALTQDMTPKASLDKAAVKVNEILAKRKW